VDDPPRRPTYLFDRGSWPETRRIADVLRKETIGGALLLAGAVVALVWANSPWAGGYAAMRDFTVGPAALHLDLSLGTWAADGLLAIFFFVAGLELKREFVAGDLRDPRRAAVPVVAAVGGVIVPAMLYVLFNLGGALEGWAVPTATDIAFALAVLAVVGRHLPTALRTFLLTLAVVDDLLAIVIIALFYTAQLSVLPLLLTLVPLGLFTLLVQRRVRSWWLLIPLAFAAWALMHASGVHATVAGVLLGFAVPVLRSRQAGGPQAGPGLAPALQRRRPAVQAAVELLSAPIDAGPRLDARVEPTELRPQLPHLTDRHPLDARAEPPERLAIHSRPSSGCRNVLIMFRKRQAQHAKQTSPNSPRSCWRG